MPRTPPFILASLVLSGGLACGDLPVGPAVHQGFASRESWGPDSRLHVLVDTVRIDTLTINAGTWVCGQPGAVLHVPGRLDVRGTADRPVLLTACDPTRGWGGIRGGEWGSDGSGRLDHVRITRAQVGIEGWDLEIGYAHFRQTRGPAISGGRLNVRDVTVDSACTGAGSCAAISTYPNTPSSLTRVVVRGSGGAGIFRGRRVGLRLEDVVVEGSAGVGLVLGNHIVHNDGETLEVQGRLRVTGNMYPASVASHDLDVLLPTPAAHASLLGNRRDTLLVGMTWGASEADVRAVLPWRISDGISSLSIPLPPRIEPGAAVASDLQVPVHVGTGRELTGTAEAAITLVGMDLRSVGDGSDTIRLRHVRLEHGASFRAIEAQPTNHPGKHVVVLEDVVAEGGRVEVACDVTASAGDGVRVLSGAGIRITDCDLHGNAGFGVNNLGDAEVDARGNWWGDPAGPERGDGDGVAGAVLFEPWLTAPAAETQ